MSTDWDNAPENGSLFVCLFVFYLFLYITIKGITIKGGDIGGLQGIHC